MWKVRFIISFTPSHCLLYVASYEQECVFCERNFWSNFAKTHLLDAILSAYHLLSVLLLWTIAGQKTFCNACRHKTFHKRKGHSHVLYAHLTRPQWLHIFQDYYCSDRRARAASAQSFTLWQQACGFFRWDISFIWPVIILKLTTFLVFTSLLFWT